ncbi:hypothetical protein T459_28996 [Capsicum annuum]|uniref:F-box domain-containing protein n=2 Tax=Capsicum annuum TaxID=4072 RepID=A0A2G2Y4S2_CAPAN|nr:hypothetical protein T459_28996 [Capsicum annuum]
MASDDGIIPGGGKVVLPLLALGGIALWINYYYKKRPTVVDDDETKEDYLSQLPDDVLCSILERGGKVVLPLLAMIGVVVWNSFFYKKRSTVSSNAAPLYKNIQYICARSDDDDTAEDYLSQLPDDVLLSILGNLTLREAARTTILSTRWRYVFASTQLQQQEATFKFRCLGMFGIDDLFGHSRCSYNQEKDKFMNGLYQFLRLHSGRRVDFIELFCCFVREFPNAFTHWFQSLSRICVERLHLYFACPRIYPIEDSSKLFKFSLEVLSQASSLKHLYLSYCILLSSPKVRFNSLTTLVLQGVALTSGHLEGILSSCSKLDELTIEFSKLPDKLRLAGTVKKVVILECDGGKEIDLHAPYLHRLKCQMNNKVTFFFSFVPMLENVMVCPGWESPCYSYTFGNSARSLRDQVKSLTLKVHADQVKYLPIEIPTEMKTFRNIRNLSLILVARHAISQILELSELWSACPRLQNFSLVVENFWGRIDNVRGSRSPLSPSCHTELKQVTYGGFDGSEVEMEFVLSILKSAIVLEQLFLSPAYEDHFNRWGRRVNRTFDERKRNSIHQKLHGRAISKKAVVIIQ